MVRVMICLAIFLFGGCARSTSAPASPSEDCLVNPTVMDEPPKDPNADPFGKGPWYINADRTIWAGWGLEEGWRAGTGLKTMWIRPAGTDLKVGGRRLDGESSPLEAGIPCCYPTGFQVVGLQFPTEGCWEVIGTAGLSELRFVTKVLPKIGSSPSRGD